LYMTILLVEDNETIANGLVYSFKKNDYNVEYKNNIAKTKKYLKEEPQVDLAVLDITLPDGNGFDLYDMIIKKMNIPTIFLTAKDDENDIVKGLDNGAEDYITKPFSTRELLARVNRVLLRTAKKNIIKIKDISFDTDKLEMYRDNEQIYLSALELKIVNLLYVNINKVVSRNTIIDKIWEWTGNYVYDHTVTVYLKRIREKIGTDIIKTVKGVGYRIDEE